MATHLSDDALLEMVDTGRSHPHLAECDRCRRAFEDVREALTLARAERVPEPSPLFWDHLSARVRDAIESDAQPVRRPALAWFATAGWRSVGAVVLLAVLVVAGIVWRAGPGGGPVGPPATGTGAKRAVPAAAGPALADVRASADLLLPPSDPSLTVLAQVTAHIDITAAADSGIVLQPDASERAISQLSPSEQQEFVRLLQADPDGPSQQEPEAIGEDVS